MTQPIPIAFGITDLNVGGAEKALVDLVTRLDRSKWTPSVVCLQPMGKLGERVAAAGIECRSLNLMSAWQAGRGLRDWCELLRETKPQALVTFLFHANLLGRFVARRASVPVHVSSVRVAERGVWWHAWMDWLTKRWTDQYVCVSEAVAQFTRASTGVDESKIAVIPNGVDVAAADHAGPVDLMDYGIRPQDLVLVFLGRLDVQKGVEVLPKAVRRIRGEAEKRRLRLLVVGDGPRRANLETSIRAEGVSEFFRLVGATDNPFSFLKAGQGLILPSVWEGMPNVVLEAMACARPVIATPVDGVVDVVEDERTGWITSGCDSAELAARIVKWMESAERREEFGKAGRKRVEEHYTIAQTVARWEELLPRMVEKY